MNAQFVFVVFRFFQVSRGQILTSSHSDIQTLESQTDARLERFKVLMSNSKAMFADAITKKSQELDAQQQKLIDGVEKSSNGNDSACNQVAEDDIKKIIEDAKSELQDFSVKEGDSFNPLVEEITATFVKQQKLENDTSESIKNCKSSFCVALLLAKVSAQELEINAIITKQEAQIVGALAKSMIDFQMESMIIQSEIDSKLKANQDGLKKCRTQ